MDDLFAFVYEYRVALLYLLGFLILGTIMLYVQCKEMDL